MHHEAHTRAVIGGIALMIRREFLRVKMEPSRAVGMLLQPLLFLLVFGLGFDQSFSLKGHEFLSYASFFYPGILAMVVLFSSIYATLTLVDDKKCGFFRLMTVSPAGLGGALIGKVLATSMLGFVQSLLFLPLLWVLPLQASLEAIALSLLFLWLGSGCCALLGVALAWISPTSSAFHAVMSIVLIPMWLLSGAMFPLDNKIFSWPSIINPMSYLVEGLRSALISNAFGSLSFVGLFLCCLCALIFLRIVVLKCPLE